MTTYLPNLPERAQGTWADYVPSALIGHITNNHDQQTLRPDHHRGQIAAEQRSLVIRAGRSLCRNAARGSRRGSVGCTVAGACDHCRDHGALTCGFGCAVGSHITPSRECEAGHG